MKTLDNELIGEWAESLREIKQIYGKDGITDIFKLVQKYLEKETNLQKIEDYLNTDYVNTIPRKNQKKYPGDILLEEKIENIIRWNAAAMVLKGVDNDSNVGGHVATFSSASTILEVGFNHFFDPRAKPILATLLYLNHMHHQEFMRVVFWKDDFQRSN